MKRHGTCRFALMTAWLALAALVEPCSAAAPFSKVRAPWFFRMMLGDFEVTVLSDGVVSLDALKLVNDPAEITSVALQESFLRNPVDTSDNAFLINTGARLILCDTGGGKLLGPTLGRLLINLEAAGYRPEQVDDILLTHMHRDHIGGLTDEGKIVFPNAVVHADRKESEFWLSKDNREKAPIELRARFQGAVDALGPYQATGHFQPFDQDADVLKGIHAVGSPGHTVGHTTYVVESKGEQLWLVGDLVNFAAVQFDHPASSSIFDGDGGGASASRIKAFGRASKERALIGGAHLPFPGLGHVQSAGTQAWRWLPLDASAVMH